MHPTHVIFLLVSAGPGEFVFLHFVLLGVQIGFVSPQVPKLSENKTGLWQEPGDTGTSLVLRVSAGSQGGLRGELLRVESAAGVF